MRWFDRTAKEICNDCGKKMRVAIFFYALQELMAGFVSVYAASVFWRVYKCSIYGTI